VTHDGWSVRRVYSKSGFTSREVFTDPHGVEWVHAASLEATELEIPMKTRGLPPLRLKRRSRPLPGRLTAGLGCDVCNGVCAGHELAF
jgi:hypothetical protein